MVGFYNYTVILTYAGVICAILGMSFAMEGNPSAAILCLMGSGFCDLFDGTIARTMKRTDQEKKFGIQIDSLADLICFGVLPTVIGHSVGLTAWYEHLPMALYTLAALIRLGYYNVTEDELQMTANTHRVHYDGLPVTTVALLIPAFYVLRPHMGDAFAHLYLGWLMLIAVLFLVKIKVRKLHMKGMIVVCLVGLAVLALLIRDWSYGIVF